MLKKALSPREVLQALYQSDPAEKTEVLTGLVLALVMEVEALRAAMIEESKAQGVAPKDSAYGQAYRDTALLTHNAAGVSSGFEKLLTRWVTDRETRNGLQMREVLMLMRLGFSPEEINQYEEEAELCETYT